MMKLLFKLIIVVVIALLTYNFFFGSPEEKESSRRVVAQVRDLSASVFDMLKSEKEKFDRGKYDSALSKIKTAIGIEKQRAAELGADGRESLAECEHMQHEQQDIEQRLAELAANTGLSEEEQRAAMRAIRDRILSLTTEAESVAERMQ